MQSTNQAQKPVQTGRSNLAEQQQITNPRTGKVERVFVNLEAVYPNPDDPTEEFSFEELRARSRGWADKDWGAERKDNLRQESSNHGHEPSSLPLGKDRPNPLDTENIQQEPTSQNSTEQTVEVALVEDMTQGTRTRKSRRTKVMEVKGETQTSTNMGLNRRSIRR